LTYNPDGAPAYKSMSTASNPSYRPGSEENSRGSTQASMIHPLPPLPSVEKLNKENNGLPKSDIEVEKICPNIAQEVICGADIQFQKEFFWLITVGYGS
uniref:Lymphoid enhancer-binding factor 1 n=1 Tax=Heligmosomoides polygyrus TaxID=6339 RepID=A0A183GW56_HELPZ